MDTIALKKSQRLLRVLFDSGAMKTMIHRRALPADADTIKLAEGKIMTTLAGKFKTTEVVTLRKIKLPEFDKTKTVDEQKALVFDMPCRYDIILGSDFLFKAGIEIKYSDATVEWFEHTIPMQDPLKFDDEDFAQLIEQLSVQEDDEFFGEDFLDSYLVQNILESKYDKTDVDVVINELKHLNDYQKETLRKVLNKYKKLFNGELGLYPHKKFHIDVNADAETKHMRAYPVPHVHLELFKKELQHLVKLGVLSPQGASEWAMPSFIIPKKDGRVRWISDLRELNKVIKRKQYPLPMIMDVLRKRSGYQFFTKLDISMQYYTFELDEESKDLCTINTPFGKFKYNRLPMGLKCSPDFAQKVMENVLNNIEDCDIYIDNIGAFSKTWESHLDLLDTILALDCRIMDSLLTL